MFAYCGNNPVIFIDENGQTAILAILAEAGIDGLVGGFVNAVCVFATTGSWTKTLEAFALGFAEGFIVGILDDAALVFKLWNAVSTYTECMQSGASWEMSLLAGLVALEAGCTFGPTGDRVTDILSDLTFGLGSSLISSAITEGVQLSGQQNQDTSVPEYLPPHKRIISTKKHGGSGFNDRVQCCMY